jgi:hypothetical protein
VARTQNLDFLFHAITINEKIYGSEEGETGIIIMCLRKYCKCVDWIRAVWNFGVVTVLYKPREFLD